MRSTPAALDQGLDSAEFVDAALDDLDRLFDRLTDAFGDRGLRYGEPDQPAAGIGDFEAALATGAKQAAERLRQLAQFGQRGRKISVLDPDFDRVGFGGQTGIADLGVAQRAADVVANLVELVLLDRVGVDFEQDVRAALQIEAEHEMALRPDRPGLDLRFREEVRHGAQADHKRGQNDRQRLPPREIQHRVDPSDPGKYAARAARKL